MHFSRAIGLFTVLASLTACDLSTEPRVPDEIDPADDTYASALGVNIATMTKTGSGVYYRDMVGGTGAEAGAISVIRVYYSGFLTNGTRFDTNVGNPEPYEIDMNGNIIPGFREGVLGMKVGGKRKFVIPASLGYGRDGDPRAGIPPNSNLVFDVELASIK